VKALHRIGPAVRRCAGLTALSLFAAANIGEAQSLPSLPGSDAPGRFTLEVFQAFDSYGSLYEAQRADANGKSVSFLGVVPAVAFGGGKPGRQFDARVTGGLRHYHDLGQLRLVDASADFGAQLSRRRNGLNLRQSVSRSTYYQYLVMPASSLNADQAMPSEGSPALTNANLSGAPADAMLSLRSGVDYMRELSKSTRLDASYYYDRREANPYTLERQGTGDLQTHYVSARLNREVGRYTRIFAGYGERVSRSQVDGDVPLRIHEILVGFDRAQALRFSRHTSLHFNTGSSIVEQSTESRFVLTGEAKLQHDFSRYWSYHASAQRGVTYLEGFTTPAIVDSFGMSLEGAIGRRTTTVARVNYSTGDIGLEGGGSSYDAYGAEVTIRVLVMRHLALFGEYVSYRHSFDDSVALPRGFDPNSTRQGLRVGLFVTVPFKDQRGAR
jgi:hypothetical protein